MIQDTSYQYAQTLDANDPLASFREQFHFPKKADGNPAIYLCGNSLGLQPKGTKDYINRELDKWANEGVRGHFKQPEPWYEFHKLLNTQMAKIVGALPDEVVIMNTLTVNIHLMMVSFYRPIADRYKILVEKSAFPSDQYAVKSQAAFHGYNPDDAIVEISPRDGEHLIRTEDIGEYLRTHGHEVALVMMGGLHYYTGQYYDLKSITQAGHEAGCIVGFDLAHAAGNVELALHDWNVDFAAWCSYKYLNSGPGSVSGCFVHERYKNDPSLPRFAGWWGTDPNTRFNMAPNFEAQSGAAGWQISNGIILSMAALRASLELFDQATMPALRKKSLQLTQYLLALLNQIPSHDITILTPQDPNQRGSQISLQVTNNKTEELFAQLEDHGVICDLRKPNVIRIAPAPIYNNFSDIWKFYEILARCCA